MMKQQMHNWSKIYYTTIYYNAPTRFDVIASSTGSSYSVFAKLHKYFECMIGDDF
jgi:hypothetical protein